MGATQSAEALQKVWAERFSAAKERGLSVDEIAKEHGTATSTVFAWRKRLFGSVSDQRMAPSSVRFAKVERATARTPSSEIEVTVALSCGAQVRVRQMSDVSWAAALIAALERGARGAR